ncbi:MULTISPECIES: hypothetical protein [unclassified Paracoccus (in: a-proteobacteria)]|uniref:hypothetical protein n=1 Tax=unclassified Paracoccus (in: a-proteobacteria) TaxID=2688777 RepID=UPI0012B250E1|nr:MULTISPECIES: hypothetical protein [unclassified Paracoccus (in: a-proteobacteria)]UXU76292.1 hypothetical protein GB879_014415 [Paracoccus sp. SMMA_5]UXU82371.1 hypothetical protein GB880_014020 [Paracoccus sp. SMMA_5_TC]
MPVLDYGHLLAPGGLYRAQIAVRTVMAWPDIADEQSRREYVATLMSIHLADLKAKRDALPDPAAADGWEDTILAIEQHEAWMATHEEFEAWFDEAGGHATVSMAPGFRFFEKDMEKRVGGWFAAGLILALVRRMAMHHADLPGGASVNKAVFILERVKLPNVPRNSHDLRKAWKTYKPVAHFCAVLFDWFMIAFTHNETPEEVGAAIEGELNESFMMFLSQAEAYLEFGLSYQPPRTKGQILLDPKETWILPQYRPWPEAMSTPQPLTGDLLAAALEYKAPIPSF